MVENLKISDYKILYDQAWNQYNVYYQSYFIRNSKFNMIGAISSILIVSEITVALSISRLFFIPIIPLLVIFLIFILNLMYNKLEIPWFEKHQLIDQLRQGEAEFYNCQIDDIYKAAHTLLAYKRYTDGRISFAIGCIFATAFLLIMVCCQIYFHGNEFDLFLK